MSETLHVRIVHEDGLYDVVDDLKRVIGHGDTVASALQDAALKHATTHVELGALVVGTDHLGRPLEEKTLAHHALHFRIE